MGGTRRSLLAGALAVVFAAYGARQAKAQPIPPDMRVKMQPFVQ